MTEHSTVKNVKNLRYLELKEKLQRHSKIASRSFHITVKKIITHC